MQVFFKGAESAYNRNILEKVGCRRYCLSYYYVRSNYDKVCALIRGLYENDVEVFIDSGDTTFLNQHAHYRHDVSALKIDENRLAERAAKDVYKTRLALVEALDRYARDFIDFLCEIERFIVGYKEFNVEPLLGDTLPSAEDGQAYIRNHFFQRAPNTPGLLMLAPQATGMAKAMASDTRSKFSSLMIPRSICNGKRGYVQFMRDWLPVATDAKIPLAVPVNKSHMKDSPLAMEFCSRWYLGAKFGQTFVYKGQRTFKVYPSTKKSVRAQLRSACQDVGVDHDLFVRNNRETVDLFNAHQWQQYAVDAAKNLRGAYWLATDSAPLALLQARQLYRTEEALVRQDTKDRLPAADLGTISVARYCNTCALQDKCPVYQPDSTCNLTQLPRVDTDKDIQAMAKQVLGMQYERVSFAYAFEKLNGRVADSDVTREMKALTQMMLKVAEAFDRRDTVTVKAKGSGIFRELFGNMGPKQPAENPTIDVTPKRDKTS